MLVLAEWQLLPLVKVDRRRHGNVRNCRAVAAEPFAAGKPLIEDAGKLVEVWGFLFEDRRIGSPTEERLHAILNQECVAARKPRAALPKQPTIDVRPSLRIGRVECCLAMLVGRVL